MATKILFAAITGGIGFELWVTDGTFAGTTLVKDINLGSGYSSPAYFTPLGNGTAVFRADDGITGFELWVTDGTAAGTALVKNIQTPPPPYGSSYPSHFAALGNGTAVFNASSIPYGQEPWVTDGTAAGTAQVANIRPSTDNSFPRYFTALGNGTAVFRADDGTHGYELWVTDGTAAGTALVTDINPGYLANSYPFGFTALGNGKALFSATDGTNGQELWVTDGTAAGTALIDIVPGSGGSSPGYFAVFGSGTALFFAYDPAHGTELWLTDGTAAGTALVMDINPGPSSSSPLGFGAPLITALGNGTAVFQVNDGTHGKELWVTDGTEAGTALVKDINPGSATAYVRNITALGNGTAVFSATDGTNGQELWVTDGTAAGTVLVTDINPGSASSGPDQFIALGDGTALFSANDGTHGSELWVTDGTFLGTTLLLDVNPGSGSSYSSSFAVLEAPCYCRGTLILTEQGEVPIEDLAIGDRVMTLSGEAKPIRWIGQRAYDGRFIAGNHAVLPIRIAASAIAKGVPTRDLWVSPEHSLYIDGVLVQAMHLRNGATIVQAETAERVEYFHMELAAHDVVFAEGAPAETFVDCDNRLMFQNGAEFAALYPEDDRPTWQFCAKRLEWDCAELTAIRAALLERAEKLGHLLDLDPDLHLIVDGEIVRPDTVGALGYRFHIPADSTAVWLASRSTVPAETVAAAGDIRRLGVAVERFVLHDADLVVEAWHGHAALCEGFQEDEATHRWTDGLGRLPAAWSRCFAGAFTLDVRLASSELGYRLPAPAGAIAIAA